MHIVRKRATTHAMFSDRRYPDTTTDQRSLRCGFRAIALRHSWNGVRRTGVRTTGHEFPIAYVERMINDPHGYPPALLDLLMSCPWKGIRLETTDREGDPTLFR